MVNVLGELQNSSKVYLILIKSIIRAFCIIKLIGNHLLKNPPRFPIANQVKFRLSRLRS